jgi:hypothetical protein
MVDPARRASRSPSEGQRPGEMIREIFLFVLCRAPGPLGQPFFSRQGERLARWTEEILRGPSASQGVALRWENGWAFGPDITYLRCYSFPKGPLRVPLAFRQCDGCYGPKGQPFTQRRATPWGDDTRNIFICVVPCGRPNGPTVPLAARRTAGPLGQRNPSWPVRFPGRCPSLGTRLGLRPRHYLPALL